jgi:serine/threonine protein phosphatase PrpC
VHFKNKNYAVALQYTFLLMDELIASHEGKKELHRLKNEKDKTAGSSMESNAGCTANVLLIVDGTLFIANAGDSRCYLQNPHQILALSEDHKPENPKELERIKKAGGSVTNGRVMGHLNLSRAIGDLEHKANEKLKPSEQMVTAMPDVVTRKIGKGDKYLILGCDGIWELQNPTQVFAHLDKSKGDLQMAAERILDAGLADKTEMGQGCDNMSVIIVQLNFPGK